MFSTSGVFNTSGDTMSASGGYHGYIGDVQYIGDIMMHVEDTMSTSGDV